MAAPGCDGTADTWLRSYRTQIPPAAGTSIQLRLRGVPLNVQCRLIVRSRTGTAEVAGVWDAWRTGTISVPASAGWLPSGIASLQVATPVKTLVTFTVAHPAAPSGAP